MDCCEYIDPQLSPVVKSLIVVVVVLILLFFCYRITRSICFHIHRKRWRIIPCALLLLVLVPLMFFLSGYVYPFDRKINFSLYETVRLDHPNFLYEGYYYPEWYGVYKWRYYESGYEADSRWDLWQFDTKKDYDYKAHSYFVSYGREVESLAYNVWLQRGYPIIDLGTQPKSAIVQFSDHIDPCMVYIYEIDRMYIDRAPYIYGEEEKIPYPVLQTE